MNAIGAAVRHDHPTVHAVDQEHAAAAAAQNILLAARALGLRAEDVIVGFLYTGALREGSLADLAPTPVDFTPLRMDWQEDLRP